MQIEFKPVPGDVERYEVLGEVDGEGAVCVGIVSRVEGDNWKFRPGDDDDYEGPCLEITAANLDELRAGFKMHTLAKAKMRANRLQDKTTELFCDAMLHNLHALANRTDSIAGFSASLCDAVSAVAFEQFEDTDARSAALEAMVKRMRTGLQLREKRQQMMPDVSELAARLKAAFGAVLSGEQAGEEDEAPTSKPAAH